jgi:protein-S-isoprenylcysteine O-methyltransferase Ste14
MAAPFQPGVAVARKEERLAFLMTPWVDKTIAVVAVIPFAWLTYIRLQSFGFDVPRVALLVQGLLFIGTMVIRKTPVRVSTTPWFWLLTFVETYWVILVFAVMRRGQRIAPYWASGSLATLGAVLMIWARLSLGRSIGLVPALRSLVTQGPYRYVRHPIYLAGSLIFVANILGAYSRGTSSSLHWGSSGSPSRAWWKNRFCVLIPDTLITCSVSGGAGCRELPSGFQSENQ